VKGHVYQKMIADAGEALDGGIERLVERIDDERAREFFRQRFFAGSWYDASPMVSSPSRTLGCPACRSIRSVASADA
jgi:hypothetical protein